jgi:hypothetical protein
MSNAVMDLDIIRPKANIVKINNKEFDLSFIPVGITFEVDELVNQKLAKLDYQKLEKRDNEEIKKAFDLSIELCVTLLSFWDSSITKEWFLKNISSGQVEKLVEVIKTALEISYEGIKQYGKN